MLEPAARRRLSNQDLLLIAKTLLESSNFPDPSTGSSWQFRALELAEQILSTTPDQEVHTLAVMRRKALSRLVHGEIFDSEDADLMQHSPADALSTARRWDLQQSQAQDFILRDDFQGARSAIEQIVSCPPARLSTLGLLVYKRVLYHYVRCLYLGGEFEEAYTILKQELATLRDNEKVKDTLMVLLVGVHCELKDHLEALRLAKSTVHHHKGSMRMNILLAEAHLHAGIKCTDEPLSSMEVTAEASFSEAESICEKAMRSFESHPHFHQVAGHDQVAKVERIAYLRAVTVVARISAWKAFHDNGNLDEARENWIKVLQAVSKCGWKKRGYMEGICHYTIAALGYGEASQRDIAMASTLIQESGFRNLIIGLGKLWFDIVGDEVERQGGRRINLMCSLR